MTHGLYHTSNLEAYNTCTMDGDGEMLVNYHPSQRFTHTPALGMNYYFDPWQRNCHDGAPLRPPPARPLSSLPFLSSFSLSLCVCFVWVCCAS